MIRIGHGYDIHAFGGDNPLILGGKQIPHICGLIAHSDGDVLLHAVCDSLLGAAGLGDIGKHFPDNDDAYKGADSRKLLKNVYNQIKSLHYSLSNIDVTVVAQTPKMAPHISDIISNLAEDLEAEQDQINVKATTTEALGFVGRKEGIAVHCVCLIEKKL